MSLPPTTILLALAIGLLAVNQLVYRMEIFTRIMALYWAMQALNAAVIATLLFWGIPGVTGLGRLVDGILILSIGMHVVQNHSALLNRRSAARRDELEQERLALEARRDEMRKRVATADRSAPSPEGPPAQAPEGGDSTPTDPG